MSEEPTDYPRVEGDWQAIDCPYCKERIDEIWDYSLNIYKEDDTDQIDCPNCEKPVMVTWGDTTTILIARKKQPGMRSAREEFDRMLKRFAKDLSNHYLENDVDHEFITTWYLKDPEHPNSRIMSAYFVFTREGIVITGDFCPGGHGGGITSVGGYGIGWFGSHKSVDYLEEKFPTVKCCTSDHAWLCALQQRFAETYQKR